jgi:hypothetical protein
MFRPAMLAAAALAFGALSAAPAEAASRLSLAPATTLAAAEWSVTGTWSGASVMLVAPRHWRNQDECAVRPMVPVGTRHGMKEDCTEAAPVGRRIPNQDECTAAPLVRVGRHIANQDGCAEAMPVGRRWANQDECAAAPVMQVGSRHGNKEDCAAEAFDSTEAGFRRVGYRHP